MKKLICLALATTLILGTIPAFAQTPETLVMEANWQLTLPMKIEADLIIDGSGQPGGSTFDINEMDANAAIEVTNGKKITLLNTNYYSFEAPQSGSLADVSGKLRDSLAAMKTLPSNTAGTTAAVAAALTTAARTGYSSAQVSNVSYSSNQWAATVSVEIGNFTAKNTLAKGTYTAPTIVTEPSGPSGGGGGGSNPPPPVTTPQPTTAPTAAPTTAPTAPPALSSGTAPIPNNFVKNPTDSTIFLPPAPKQVETTVKPVLEGTAASVTVNTAALTETLATAKADVSAGEKVELVLHAEAPMLAKTISVNVSAQVMQDIQKNLGEATLTIDTGALGKFTLDTKTIETLAKSGAAGEISLSSDLVDNSTLSEKAKQTVGDAPVFNFNLQAGGQKISKFGGTIRVSVNMEVTNKDPESIVAYYLGDNAKLDYVMGTYNPTSKNMSFEAKHFSQYTVLHNPVHFTDVTEKDWYAKPTAYIAARGITQGVTPTEFGGAATITRAEFLVMLMRAFAVDVSNPPSANFSDAGNTYYTPYLAVAKAMGITNGVDGTTYNPNAKISREQMFTLIYRTLDKLQSLPQTRSTRGLSDFKDANAIGGDYQSAMKFLVESGMIKGSDGTLTPKSEATRAQMSQIIYELLITR